MSPRSILLVSYFFPPTRDTGAQRPAAMAKYLARLGHRVSVLTTNAFGDEDPGIPEVEVLRANDLQRIRARMAGHERIDSLFDSDTYGGKPHPLSYAIWPEPLRLAWEPFARRLAIGAHRERNFDAVITTSPPESAHLLGRALQRRGVPWVADVRDAWSFEPLRPRFPTSLQHRLDLRMERRLLGAADAVVCVSEPAAEDLRRRWVADPEVIYNAWDPDSEPTSEAVAEAAELLDPDRTSLVYTGRFGSYGRDPRALCEAMGGLADSDPEAAGELELAIAGPLRADERELLESVPAPAKVSLLGSLQRDRSLALQRAADALVLLAQPTRSQLVNFKLFEYLAAGRPIVGLCAGTEAGRILAETAAAEVVRADHVPEIAALLGEVAAGELGTAAGGADPRFAYPAAAEAMAAVVDRVIAGG
ncbi:MAG: glycosyltransferase [Solirubrobacterales bacterium]